MKELSGIPEKFPTLAQVKGVLQGALEKFHPNSNVQNPAPSTSPPLAKRYKSSHWQNVVEASARMDETFTVADEVTQYLATPILPPQYNPIQFWDENKSRFPGLAKVASSYLGMSASSGCVERLFSMAGSVQRERRAKTTTKNLNEILTIREELWERHIKNAIKNTEDYEKTELDADDDFLDILQLEEENEINQEYVTSDVSDTELWYN